MNTPNLPPIPSMVCAVPILRPPKTVWEDDKSEESPADMNICDLVYLRVKSLMESDYGKTVRVINMSYGNRQQPFNDRRISPLARLLDWLSQRYNILFVVSAGNSTAIDVPKDVDDNDYAAHILNANFNSRHTRRLLSPAESLNALTVGATNADDAPRPHLLQGKIRVLAGDNHPSPINSFGFGARQSIKPDVVFAGGRTGYDESRESSQFYVSKEFPTDRMKLGIRSAKPIATNAYVTNFGTSNSAALVSNIAARVYHNLEDIFGADPSDDLKKFTPQLLRAMIVHAAHWEQQPYDSVEQLVSNHKDYENAYHGKQKNAIAGMIGYKAGVMPRLSNFCKPCEALPKSP